MRYIGTLLLAAGLASLSEATPTWQFAVQPIVAAGTITDSAKLAEEAAFLSAIFGQAGIHVSLLTPIFDSSISADVWDFNSYNFDFGGRVDVLPVWFVKTILGGSTYRGISMGDRVWVTDYRAADTAAHELAHILTGLLALWQPDPADAAHSLDPANLLAPGSIRTVPLSLDQVGVVSRLESVQTAAMIQSGRLTPYAFEVPEPALALPLAAALALILVRRRRFAENNVRRSPPIQRGSEWRTTSASAQY